MSVQYPKLNTSKNEFLIFPTNLQTSAILLISLSGDSLLPVAQIRTLETSPILPFHMTSWTTSLPPNIHASDLLADQTPQADLVATLQKYLLLN